MGVGQELKSRKQVSWMLDRLYERFDAAADSVGAYKIETIGVRAACQ